MKHHRETKVNVRFSLTPCCYFPFSKRMSLTTFVCILNIGAKFQNRTSNDVSMLLC
jgi:hypothetical protein